MVICHPPDLIIPVAASPFCLTKFYLPSFLFLVMQSLHLDVPAAQRSPAGVRAAGQSSATTANSCGIPTRRATPHGSKGPNTSG